jgi:cysteine desulfurase/selenocysteine lyase
MPEDKVVYGDVANLLDQPDWQEMRRGMPVARLYAYLDHAAVGPLTGDAARELAVFAEEAAMHGDVHWPQWYAKAQLTKRILAASLDTDADRISLIPNTSTAISQIAAGFPWKTNANVVSLDSEFPANERPWSLLAGVELRRIPWVDGEDPIKRMLDGCDSSTQMIAVSWVGYGNGYRLDIHRLVEEAEKRGIAVFLDAIQGLGVYALSLRDCPVHFMAADGHKWMLGPEGVGLLYVRQDWSERIHPVLNGWHNPARPFEFRHGDKSLATDGRRFEPGTLNMVGIQAYAASLNFLRAHGWTHESNRMPERIRHLREYLVEALRKRGVQVQEWPDEHASGIVPFLVPDISPTDFRAKCLDRRIVLSARAGWVRAAIHAYNNEEDLDQLADVVSPNPKRHGLTI